jgi:hypothetical protein
MSHPSPCRGTLPSICRHDHPNRRERATEWLFCVVEGSKRLPGQVLDKEQWKALPVYLDRDN